MVLTVLELFLVTLGVKLLLGSALIYYLLPTDRRCVACDGDTLPLQAPRGLRWLGRVSRIERRLCLSCGGSMVGRRGDTPSPVPGPVDRAGVERAG